MAPVWIALIAVGAQATGVLQTTAAVLKGVDESVTAIVNLHKYVPQVGAILHPPAKPVVKKHKKAAKQ